MIGNVRYIRTGCILAINSGLPRVSLMSLFSIRSVLPKPYHLYMGQLLSAHVASVCAVCTSAGVLLALVGWYVIRGRPRPK
jgi:hypothetical protein